MSSQEHNLLNDIIKALVHDIAELHKIDEQQLSIIKDYTRAQLCSMIREVMREEHGDGLDSGKQMGQRWVDEHKGIAEAFVKKMQREFLTGLGTCISLATAHIDWEKVEDG